MAGTNLSDRDAQLGPGLIGAFVTLVLFGILTSQCYSYSQKYTKDHTANRVLVAVIWFLDAFGVATMCHAAYFYFVTNYGNPNPFEFATWSLVVTLLLNMVIAFLVQLYFTMRIFDLSTRNWWLTGVVTALVLAHFAFGLLCTIQLFIKRNIGLIDGLTLSAAVPWAAFTVASDIAIAGSLCWLLRTRRTGFKDTNTIIDTLMIYAINRCLLTCVLALLEVILFITLPDSLSFISVELVIGKIYANSLMAALNSRARILDKGSQGSKPSTTGADVHFTSRMSVSRETAEMFGVTIPEGEDARRSRVLDLYHRGRRGNTSVAEEEGLSLEEKEKIEQALGTSRSNISNLSSTIDSRGSDTIGRTEIR